MDRKWTVRLDRAVNLLGWFSKSGGVIKMGDDITRAEVAGIWVILILSDLLVWAGMIRFCQWRMMA